MSDCAVLDDSGNHNHINGFTHNQSQQTPQTPQINCKLCEHWDNRRDTMGCKVWYPKASERREITQFADPLNPECDGEDFKPRGEIDPDNPPQCVDVNNRGEIKPDPHTLATKLMDEEDFFTDKTDVSYWFDHSSGMWVSGAENIIKARAEQIWMDYSNNYAVNELLGKIKRKTNTAMINKPELPINIIPLQNGLFDVNNWQLLEHTPDYFYTFRLPVHYNAEADCPKFRGFMEQIQPDEDNRKKLQEFMGYCLWRENFIHKAFMLVGDGGNGKSTFIKVLINLLGRENCTGMGLHELQNDQFAASYLDSKLANLSYELSSRELKGTSKFKAIVSGDPMNVQRKFGHMYTMVPYTKLIFACNEIPMANDDTDAFFQRWELIEFPNRFRGMDEEDKHILDKLTTEEELSGILNYALVGLVRLLGQEEFTNPIDTETARDTYKRKASNLYAFVQEKLEQEPGAFILKDAFIEEYYQWCKDNNMVALSKRKISEELPEHAPYIKVNDRRKVNGRQTYGYGNVKWLGDEPFYGDGEFQTQPQTQPEGLEAYNSNN